MSARTSPTADRTLATSKETRSMPRSRPARRLLPLVALALCLGAFFAASAAAATPRWQLHASTADDVIANKRVTVFAWLENVGDTPLTGSVTVTDTFPSRLVPYEPEIRGSEGYGFGHTCQNLAQETICEIDVDGLAPGGQLRLEYQPLVSESASGTFVNTIAASGGGMPTGASLQQQMTVTSGLPPFEIERFSVEPLDSTGQPAVAAGSAPFEITTTLAFRSLAADLFGQGAEGNNELLTTPPEHFRDIAVHLPVGMIGFPTATPAACTTARLAEASPSSPGQKTSNCPQDSQVGTVHVLNPVGPDEVGLYNMVPPPGSPAAFGFTYEAVTIVLTARLRPSDNGVDIVARTAPSSLAIPEIDTTFWGVPLDHRHDYLRHLCMDGWHGNNSGKTCSSEAPPKPFLRLPTSCPGEAPPWGLEVDTYEHPETFIPKQTTTPALAGCPALPFKPSLKLATSTGAAHSPTGLDATISVPQEAAPTAPSEADLRRAVVTLPQGMAINPASADGLAGCTDAQLRLGLEGPAQCPDASKIGSLTLQTPLLGHSLSGSVFIRSQGPGTPSSGDFYRLALEIRSDDDGVDIKLAGKIEVDPATGQLTTVFEDLPQLPFETLHLHLDAGPHAALSLPQACGTYAARAEFTGWNDKQVTVHSRLTVNQGCGSHAFAPGFSAGVQNNTAGDFSPFTLRVTRDPGQPNLARIDATLPEGELAKLAGVPLCPDAAAVSGVCPDASKVGSVIAAIGDSPNPLYLPQAAKAPTAVYLAGPYRGAPYSLVTAVPAQAGPFDLGTVTVRSATSIDPVTTQLSVRSDPLPQIQAGIPVSYRDVRFQVDRPHFTINPTNCEPQAVYGTLTSAAGDVASASDRFQVGDCAGLGFKPRLSLRLTGPPHRAAHPRLRAVVTARRGDANIGKATVLLPKSELLENAHIRTICTRVQYAAGSGGGAGCPAGSAYGYAKAWSPLLDRPLQGPVYLRANGGERELPDLVASLGGQIHVDLVGYIDSVNARIRNRFVTVPDAPVSKFVLTMQGGKKGLLANSTNLCRGTRHVTVQMEGQNGRPRAFKPLLKVGCRKAH